ncbi:MAG: PAS domain S-box-containing protein [Halobacteriales archaeon]
MFSERALNTLEDLFFVMDTDGYLQRVNDPAREVTGYSEEAITSMRPSELFAPEDRVAIQAALAEVLKTGEATVEATLVTAEGKRRRYEFRTRRPGV